MLKVTTKVKNSSVNTLKGTYYVATETNSVYTKKGFLPFEGTYKKNSIISNVCRIIYIM